MSSTRTNIETVVQKIIEQRAKEKANGSSPSWVCVYFPQGTNEEIIKQFSISCRSADMELIPAWWIANEYDRETDATSPIIIVRDETQDDAYVAMGAIHADASYNKPEYEQLGVCVRCRDFRRVNNDGSVTKLTDVVPTDTEQNLAYMKKKYNMLTA